MRPTPRLIMTAVAVSAMLATAGCSWFNSRGNGYAQNPRPLEVPPDMVASAPAGQNTGSVLASSSAASLQGFQIAGTRAEAFTRIGAALGTLAGVKIASSSQMLGLYDLSYNGTPILLRISDQNGQVVVTGVDPRGNSETGPAIQEFLKALQAKL